MQVFAHADTTLRYAVVRRWAFVLTVTASFACGGRSVATGPPSGVAGSAAMLVDSGIDPPNVAASTPDEAEPSHDAGPSLLDAGAPPISIDGIWDVAGFVDPMQLQIDQRGTELTGMGCLGGLPPSGTLNYCGPIVGQLEGRQVQLDFTGNRTHYRVRAWVSAAGDRIAGAFDLERTDGFTRLTPSVLSRHADLSAWVPGTNVESLPRSGHVLRWSSSPVDHGEFDTALLYHVTTQSQWAYGSFGSFWRREMVVEPGGLSWVAGPVPDTDPSLPTRVEQIATADGVQVVVETHSGGRYVFSSVPWP